MRALLVATPFAALGCLGAESTRERGTARGLPAWTVTLELDRSELPATDELAGTIVVIFDPAVQQDGNGVPGVTLEIGDWQVEFANERTPLLDLVIESEDRRAPTRRLAAGDAARFRFRMAPCAAFAEHSSHSPVALQRLAPGNHAMRIVAHGVRVEHPAAGDGTEQAVDPFASFASRWTPFDVVDAGRPLDADDLEAILLTADDEQAAKVLDFGCSRLGASERMVAIVAHANGQRRGRLAEAMVRHVYPVGEWWPDPGGWPAFRSLFTEIDETGLDCRSHDSPPFFARFEIGRNIPIQIHSSQFCNFKVLLVYQEATTANFALSTQRQTINSGDMVTSRGLFRITCDVHPRIWGWLLVE